MGATPLALVWEKKMAWPDGGMGPRLHLNLSQKLVMTPQLQQAIQMLQLSRLELQQAIRQEMMENPILEEGSDEADEAADTPSEESASPDAQTDTQADPPGAEADQNAEGQSLQDTLDSFEYQWEDGNDFTYGETEVRDADERSPEGALSRPASLVDHLAWQLRLSHLTGAEQAAGVAIIGNLDENGYLALPLEEVAVEAGAPLAACEAALAVIQGFEPAGVGARDLTECLLIQIAQLGKGGTLAEQIVKAHLPALQKREYQRLADHFRVPMEAVLDACKTISHLEPKPCRPFYATENMDVIPDVYAVKAEGGGYTLRLNEDGLPRLKIAPYYRRLLRSMDRADPETRSYLQKKLKSALWLVKSIEQRNQTIHKVAQSILKLQAAFFEKGVEHLKPLILQQVADDIAMHPSTVSRITTRKYIHTSQGIYEMKFFFSSRLATANGDDAEGTSGMAVREMIRRMIAEENPAQPLTDHDLVKALGSQNVEIARRTVSKYREMLKIPSANLRRRIAQGATPRAGQTENTAKRGASVAPQTASTPEPQNREDTPWTL